MELSDSKDETVDSKAVSVARKRGVVDDMSSVSSKRAHPMRDADVEEHPTGLKEVPEVARTAPIEGSEDGPVGGSSSVAAQVSLQDTIGSLRKLDVMTRCELLENLYRTAYYSKIAAEERAIVAEKRVTGAEERAIAVEERVAVVEKRLSDIADGLEERLWRRVEMALIPVLSTVPATKLLSAAAKSFGIVAPEATPEDYEWASRMERRMEQFRSKMEQDRSKAYSKGGSGTGK